jgi:2-acylglycerol O-acyltransferase 2
MLAFLVLWLFSLATPFVIAALLLGGATRGALALAAVAAACYVPGLPKSPGLRAWFRIGSQAYYRNCSLKYEEPFVSGGSDKGVATTETNRKVLCVHPHGIFCQGWGILFTRPELQSLTFCFASSLYASPFFGALSKIIGRPAPADKTTFQNLMKSGRSIALIPGGFQEATIHSRDSHRVTCGKGFIKYALEHGYSLVPSYAFGENKTYNNFQGLWSTRLWLNKFGIPAVVPFGSWLMPVLPKNDGSMHIVVGKALKLPQIDHPTRKQVDGFHKKYTAALVSLFDRHKAACGEPEARLEVW